MNERNLATDNNIIPISSRSHYNMEKSANMRPTAAELLDDPNIPRSPNIIFTPKNQAEYDRLARIFQKQKTFRPKEDADGQWARGGIVHLYLNSETSASTENS